MNTSINESELKGHCDNQFVKVIEVLEENLSSGDDLGASFAMTVGDPRSARLLAAVYEALA